MALGFRGNCSEEMGPREEQHCEDPTALPRSSLPFLEMVCEMNTSEGRISTPTRDP